MRGSHLVVAALSVSLSGCAWLAPDYERTVLHTPQKWIATKPHQAKGEISKEWWKDYHDAVLEKLITEALANNGDLALAMARLQQARAQLDYAFSNQLPLLSVNGLESRSAADFENSDVLTEKPSNALFFGGVLTYELDLWGKMASASQATKAALAATKYNQDATRLSVAAATAQLYFHILALDADIKVTEDTIRSREEAYQLVKKQYDREVVNALVLRQSEAEMEGARARLPQLIVQKDKAESSLAVLLGRSPHDIIEGRIDRGSDISALPVPPVMPDILPSSLVERRPDIASAEEALIASNFNIGIAKAAFFPEISLSALLGISSIDIQNIYRSTMRTWQLGAALAGPVIDFGRTSSGVDIAKAENQQLLVSYKNSVRAAFKDVKDALSAQVHSQREEQAQARQEKTLKEALRLANLRHSAGYSNYIEVLDAERNLYGSQIALIAAKLNRLNASVSLYKALGGGWIKKNQEVTLRMKNRLNEVDFCISEPALLTPQAFIN